MHPMTAANLRNAYGGESMAHMRYGIWGDKAEKDGYPNVARLFRAIASAETIHATGHFATYGVGVSLLDMRDPEKARGRTPVS